MNESLTPQEVQALKKEILSSLHCALPGIIESFDELTQTASVRPAVKKLPVLRDVPVFFPGNGAGGVTWPVSPGDGCLLVFADGDTDRWLEEGTAEEPASGRLHALSDAFAFAGFRSRPGALPEAFPGEPAFFGNTFSGMVKETETTYTTPALNAGGASFLPHVTSYTTCAAGASKSLGRLRNGAVIIVVSDAKGADILIKSSSTGFYGDGENVLKNNIRLTGSSNKVTLANNDTVTVAVTVIA